MAEEEFKDLAMTIEQSKMVVEKDYKGLAQYLVSSYAKFTKDLASTVLIGHQQGWYNSFMEELKKFNNEDLIIECESISKFHSENIGNPDSDKMN
jgi:hypothetical protein